MTIDYAKHKNILLQILKDIFTDTCLAPYVGFKGGTASMLFYGLDRHSVDIDLDLLDPSKEKEVFEKIQNIAKNYGKIIDSKIKRFNLITVVAYDLKSQNIKIEVNRRNFGSKYELRSLLGISMLVMVREDMFANKLVAMVERVGKTSRDVYDVYFFLKNNWPLNIRLIEDRTQMRFDEFLDKCIKVLGKMDHRRILDGLGEILNPAQKDWARTHLLADTIFLLKAFA